MNRLGKRSLSCVLIAALLVSSSPLALAQETKTAAGDLNHMTFTATTGLWARILSPTPKSPISSPATVVEVATGIGQGIELRINGDIVPAGRIGKRVVDGPANQTRYTFYGIPLQGGANVLIATPLGAGNLRGYSVSETIYGPGEAAYLDTSIAGRAVADGRSILTVTVAALDGLHHPAHLGSSVKVSVASGDASFIDTTAQNLPAPAPSASENELIPNSTPSNEPSSTPGNAPSTLPLQEKAEQNSGLSPSLELQLGNDGTVRANLLAGLRPGDVTIRASIGDLHVDKRFFLAPALRAPFVLGLASVGVGQVPAAPGEAPTVPDGANSRRGRLALFATGDIGADTLGTLAYDTADALARTTGYGAFGSSDALANRPYEIVGDASITRDDALSNDHLYLRFDRKRSSAMWGEFQAQTGGDSGDGFNLLVDGAKLELANQSEKLMLFNARNNVAYARQIFSPLGLSTVGTLLHPSIVVGSDIISLVTLDRNSGAIIQQTQLQQNADYTIDYNTGALRFISIPLPYDSNFNPQQIVVQYQYDGSGLNAETSGARLDVGTRRLHFGAGYANDAYGTGNFSLLSENLSGELHGGAWSLEHLTSNGIVVNDQALQTLGAGAGGDALRAALNFGDVRDKFNAAFDSTTAGFNNPFGGLSAPGLLTYHAGYTHTLMGDRGQLTFAFNHASNSNSQGTNSQSQASLNLQRKLTKRFSLTAGLNGISGPSAGSFVAPNPAPAPAPSPTAGVVPSPSAPPISTSTSIQGNLGFDWHLLPTIDLNASRSSGLGHGSVASQPGQTTAELGVDFLRKGRAYIRELWTDAPVQSFASSTSLLTNQVSGTHATEIGFQRSLGVATTFTSAYTIQQTGNGSDITSSMGVQERLEISKRLRGNFSVQRAVGIGSGTGGFNVYGLDMSYSTARLHGSGSYQLRTGSGSGAGLHLGATGSISPDFSLVALFNDSSANGLVDNDERLGVAYRPSGDDRGVTLLQYELKNTSSAQLGTRAATISLDQAFHPNDRLELAGRYAYKLDGDAYYPAQSELFGFRIDQRIGSRFDVGSEIRYLDVRHIAGASSTGFALESGLRIGNEMRLAVGYNFTGSPDPALAAAPTRRGVYVTLTSVIDRILGWGR